MAQTIENQQWSKNNINQPPTKQEQIIQKQLNCVDYTKKHLTKQI